MTTKPFKPIIFNKSRYSTSLLRKMIKLANFTVGCKGPVVFKITPGSRINVSGEAYKSSKFYMKRISKKFANDKYLETTNGWISISPPRGVSENYLIQSAKQLFSTIVHELKHVYDFQTDHIYNWDWDYKSSTHKIRTRRQNWSKRPQEIRAQQQEKDSLHLLNTNSKHKVAFENLIIDFSIELNENH